jgi:hypothetical protein
MTLSHVQDIMTIKHFLSKNLWPKAIFFKHIYFKKFVIEFKNYENEYDHRLLWIKNVPMYGVHTNEEIEQFIDMYISCDASLRI